MLPADAIPTVLPVGRSKVTGLSEVNALAFTPDGRGFLTAGFDGVRRWDLATGAEAVCYRPYSGYVCWQAAVAGGGRLVVAGFGDLTLRVWDYSSGKELRQLAGHGGIVTGVAASPDGSRVVTGAPDKTVRWWDPAAGAELGVIRLKTAGSWRAAYSPDGRRFAAAGNDKTVRVFDAADGRLLHTLTGHTGWVEALAFSPDGRRLASTGRDKTVRLWDVSAGAAVAVLEGARKMLRSVAFAPDGRHLLAAGGESVVHCWDLSSGERRTLPPAPAASSASPAREAAVTCIAISPDGATVLGGCSDGRVLVWRAAAAVAAFAEGTGAKAADGKPAKPRRPSAPRRASGGSARR
jgi:WD40 repeat protein